MVQNQELANSFVGSAVGSHKGEPADGYQIDKRALWGLYAVYAAIGTVNGFFATFLATPTICQYVFGPLGVNVQITQCNVAPSVFQMSWNFKLFFGFFLDNISFFGSRRKGWLLFGWTGGLIMLAVNAILVTGFVEHHEWSTYMYSLMGMCIFYTFSDVAGDGLIIELSKYEPDDRRGYILTSCQMVRFTMMMAVTVYGMLFMSGKDYQPADGGSQVFPFELPFYAVHWGLLIMALPFYAMMWMFLKDPPAAEDHPRGCAGLAHSFGRIWQALKSYAIFMLLIQMVGIQGISGLQNPALQDIAMIASPSNFQSSLGCSIGNLMFVVGVWLFRKYLLTYNWRLTLIWTHAMISVLSILAIMIIYDTWGISQNGWFYLFYNQIPSFIQGLCQVLGSLAVIEVSPAGLEATIYELLISANNGALALSAALQSVFAEPFELDGINGPAWADYHCARSNGTWSDVPAAPICNKWENRMASATWMTLAVNLLGVVIFMWFMPKNGAHCREWAAKASWHTNWAGALNFVVFFGPFIYSTYTTLSFN